MEIVSISQYLKESILKNEEAVLKYVRVQESDQANTIRLHVFLELLHVLH